MIGENPIPILCLLESYSQAPGKKHHILTAGLVHMQLPVR